jgi:hypothetical protein
MEDRFWLYSESGEERAVMVALPLKREMSVVPVTRCRVGWGGLRGQREQGV